MGLVIKKSLKVRELQEFWVSTFWRYPNRLFALKVAIAVAVLVIPFVALNLPFFGVTLALGALAAGLSETDDHPKGRIKALILTLISFAISSASVELLRPFPILFSVGLVGSTLTFIILGGLGERYRGVTFGALLVAIYTMLGGDASIPWYWQPLLLPAGGLCYGILSLSLLAYRPWRLLEEQLAQGFEDLSLYMKKKSELFPSEAKVQEKLINRLSLQNIQVINSLERCKNVLNSYADALKDQTPLSPYLHQFLLLQSLHERAASSHERYDLLSEDTDNHEMLEGLGQLLLQLSQACHQLSKSMLTGSSYQHPVALKWTISALKNKVKRQISKHETNNLSLLLKNLTQSHISLQNLNFNVETGLLPRVDRDHRSLWERFTEQLSWKHPRLRYAIRLSACFLVGYMLMIGFNIDKGEWILLTSLFVCQPSYSETRRRLFQRVLGTLTGVLVGVLIAQIMPTMAGQTVLMLVSGYAFCVWLRKNYAVSVIFITIFVIAAFNLLAGKGLAILEPRIIDTLIGALLAIAAVRFLWPDWQQKHLSGLLISALDKNVTYFSMILSEYQEHQADDLNYRIARHKANLADNALVLAWKSMKLEPKKQQKFQKHAFSLTYLNHALLSYLSALGAHKDTTNYISKEQQDMFHQIEMVLLKAVKALNENKACDPSIGLHSFLDELSSRLDSCEKGVERQKLALIYNIAEVSEQLLREASHIAKETKA
ncbi:YccS family putative transporter [Ancylomarina sp. 16SWW S1-10-2]|uniref:YccS family putative transporter n=1 Tax=Ancylomarina sp. 16SWW S1-10-2 TaxID=2499681 RepID=UPI0012AE32B0|nr:YccS family putative transporter [Ancylomarina sp. 16SWW S1-10-2]MRT93519.1 TIGR01666 family membrane protein [Ancylomarina sp. 16SWW S1-10-2]